MKMTWSGWQVKLNCQIFWSQIQENVLSKSVMCWTLNQFLEIKKWCFEACPKSFKYTNQLCHSHYFIVILKYLYSYIVIEILNYVHLSLYLSIIDIGTDKDFFYSKFIVDCFRDLCVFVSLFLCRCRRSLGFLKGLGIQLFQHHHSIVYIDFILVNVCDTFKDFIQKVT